VKVLLLNNEGDGMVRQWQTLYFGKRYYAIDKNLHSINFVKAVEAMGFPFAKRISKPEELGDALRAFVSSVGAGVFGGDDRSQGHGVSHGGTGIGLQRHGHRGLDSRSWDGVRSGTKRRRGSRLVLDLI
jgi:hypothetical protein